MKKRVVILVTLVFAVASMAMGQKMTVKDSDANVLMEVNDEGAIGSIMLPQGSAPGTTTNKLYNVGGTLYWNGNELSLAGSAGGWTDGGTNVYLTTSTDKVGIGDASPTHTLDVAGKIGINDTQILYLPDQTDFTGTLYLGDGGGSLSHSSDLEGQHNTSVGIGALNANTTGFRNTAIGYGALNSNTTGYDNTVSGMYALFSNTGGYSNTATGFYALYSNTSGQYNTASGQETLYLNTTGSSNTALGFGALYSNTTGFLNTAIGYGALASNDTGNNNTAVGLEANSFNQDGSSNTIIGYQAGRGTSAHDKSGNVFIGYQAGYSETGSNKLYIENSNSPLPLIGGDFSQDELYFNGDVGIKNNNPNSELDVTGTVEMTGFKLTTSPASGYVLISDASGIGTWQAPGGGDFSNGGEAGGGDRTLGNFDNYALGFLTANQQRIHIQNDGKVGIGNTSPTHTLDVAGNIGIDDTQVIYLPDQTDFFGTLYLGDGGGSLSHSGSSDGRYNTAVGIKALNNNTTGYENTAIGPQALYANETGHGNIAIGRKALFINNTGSLNTASGYMALSSNYGGDSNTASGYEALYSNTEGNRNTASGHSALRANTTGHNNTAIGYYANRYNETGSDNTIIGYEAGRGTSLHDKSGNVFIGYQAGYSTHDADNYNIFIGYQAGYSETGSYKLYIENSNSSSPLIGGDFDADELYFNGDVGIGMTSPNEKLTVEGIISLDEQSSDPVGHSGYGKFYAKDDGKVYFRNDGGTTYDLTAGTGHWELGTNGVFEDDAGVIVGIDQAETLSNSGFGLTAGDLFVQDQLGVEGNIYTDGSFIAGGSLTFTDGSITQSAGSALNVILGGGSGDDFIVDTNTLVVESDNNRVGIGTTAPEALLDVTSSSGSAATIGASATTATGVHAIALGANADASDHYAIAMGTGATASGRYATAIGTDITVSGERSVGIGVGTSSATISTDNIMVIMGGNVGIGETSPSSRLDVAGDIETGSSNAFYFGDPDTDGSWRIVRSDSNLVFQRRESGGWVTKDTITP